LVFQGNTLIVAFEGWNDAGDAASTAARFLCEELDSEIIAAVDPEDYYDFQYSRPEVQFDSAGNREINWPTTELFRATKAGSEHLYFLIGVEPSRRWKTFVDEVLEAIEEQEIRTVIFMGALYSEMPHTRPIHLVATSQSSVLRESLGLEKSEYTGPVGLLTVLGTTLDESHELETLALWAEVPHYTHGQACPKAALALASRVEGFIGRDFEHGELSTEAFAWERRVDEMVEGDDELSGYIAQLEAARDAATTAEESSDAMVEEVERFLRNKAEPDESAS
jgi:predicted ATP-grasp superfamily ATP-dependent carboligase